MASHNVSWVPSAHVLFGDLDFIVTTEGEMAMAPAIIQPLHYDGLDAIAEALEELQLHASEAHALGSNQLLNFDYGRLERQLDAFLGPPTILGGPAPPHLLVRQHHGAACRGRAALPGIPHPERPDSAPVWSPQRRRDHWPPYGATHTSIPYK